MRVCSGLAELSAPRISGGKEGLVIEENQQNSLERKVRRWCWLSTLFCGVMGESQKYKQKLLTELYTSAISLSLLLSFEIRTKELFSFVPCVRCFSPFSCVSSNRQFYLHVNEKWGFSPAALVETFL